MCTVGSIPHIGKETDEIKDVKNSASPEPSQEHNETQERSNPSDTSQTEEEDEAEEGTKSAQKPLLHEHNRTELNKEEEGKVQGDTFHTELDKEANTNTRNKGKYAGSDEPYPQDNDCISQENTRERKENKAEVKDGEIDVSNEKQQEGGDQTDAPYMERSAEKTKLQTDLDTERNSKGIITRVAEMGKGIGEAISSHLTEPIVSNVTSVLWGQKHEHVLNKMHVKEK